MWPVAFLWLLARCFDVADFSRVFFVSTYVRTVHIFKGHRFSFNSLLWVAHSREATNSVVVSASAFADFRPRSCFGEGYTVGLMATVRGLRIDLGPAFRVCLVGIERLQRQKVPRCASLCSDIM